MNGRLYDPQVGRFLNADPVIKDPGNTQHYNRYSYCLNNPLKYSDPSGYYVVPDEASNFGRDIIHLRGPDFSGENRKHHGGGGTVQKSSTSTYIILGFYYHDKNGNPVTKSGINGEVSGEFYLFEVTDYNSFDNSQSTEDDNWASKVSDGLMWRGMALEAGKQELALSGIKSFGNNLKAYSNTFYSNQYVKTIQVTKVINAAKIIGISAGTLGITADMVNYFGFNEMSANRFNTKFAIGLISFVAPEIGIPLALIDYYYGDFIGDQINNAMLQINKKR